MLDSHRVAVRLNDGTLRPQLTLAEVRGHLGGVLELFEDAEHIAALLGADGEEGQGELEAGGQDLARQGARCAIDPLQLSLLGRPFEDREPLSGGPGGGTRTLYAELEDGFVGSTADGVDHAQGGQMRD